MATGTQVRQCQSNFVPSPTDVRETRSILASLRLPTELVLLTLDYAHYWVEVTTETTTPYEVYDEGWSEDFTVAFPYLCVPLQLSKLSDGEQPKIRELDFTIDSHDQGWTTEDTEGTYKTSSWFEVSQMRSAPGDARFVTHLRNETKLHNIEEVRRMANIWGVQLMPRPSTAMESHRLHCPEMKKVTWPAPSFAPRPAEEEGTHAWWLQGNVVARDTIKRYRLIWGCAANPRWEGNEGAGKGEGFIDGLQNGDWIVVWARAKRRGWENHVFKVCVTARYTI